MENNSRAACYVKLILAIAIWASIYHVAKIATKVADVEVVAFVRYLITAIVFIFLHRFKTGRFIPNLDKNQWLWVCILGIVGVFLYNFLFFSAEALISGNIVAIMYAFAPCLTTIISSYVFKTSLSWLSKLGILIALLGSLGVINYATPECGKLFCPNIITHVGRGEIFGILATIMFACYAVISKYTAQKNVAAITMNTYAAVVGCICLGLITIINSDLSVIPHLGFEFWASEIYMSIIATVLAYIWYLDAIFKLGVFKTVIFQNTIPLQAVIIGYIFFGATIGAGALICGIVVLCGVYITNYALSLNGKV